MKPELTYDHLYYLTGCILLALYCVLATILSSNWDQYWLAFPFSLLFLLFFSYEASAEVIWLIKNREEEEKVDD